LCAFISIYRSLKKSEKTPHPKGYKQEEAPRKTPLHVKTPYPDRIGGYKHEEEQRKHLFMYRHLIRIE